MDTFDKLSGDKGVSSVNGVADLLSSFLVDVDLGKGWVGSDPLRAESSVGGVTTKLSLSASCR